MLHQRHLTVTILTIMTVCCPISHASNLRFLLRDNTATTTYEPLIPDGGILPLQLEIDALSNIEVQEDGSVVMEPLGKSYLRSLFHLNRQSECTTYPVMCNSYELAPGDCLTIASPYHPKYYPSDYECEWNFTTTDGGEMALECTSFTLNTKDYMTVQKKINGGAKWYRWNETPQVDTTVGGFMRVYFKTSTYRQEKGFTCTVRHLDDPTTTTTSTTTTTPTTTTTTTPTTTTTTTTPTTTTTTTTPTTTTTTTPTTTTTTTPTTTTAPIQCGQVASRIVNGEEAGEHAYPWQVLLEMTWSDSGRRCGGSIIDESWILTAAHCIYKTNAANTALVSPSVRVAVGGHALEDPTTHGGYWVDASLAIMHPQLKLTHDIALVKLSTPLTFSITVAPICLPTRDWAPRDLAGVACTLSGWGKTETGSLAPTLRMFDTVGYSFASCRAFYGSWMRETQMCTSGMQMKHVCSGDSGGPVMTEGAEGRMVQVGVISFGSAAGRCKDTSADGHVRVAAFIPWFEQVTGNTYE